MNNYTAKLGTGPNAPQFRFQTLEDVVPGTSLVQLFHEGASFGFFKVNATAPQSGGGSNRPNVLTVEKSVVDPNHLGVVITGVLAGV